MRVDRLRPRAVIHTVLSTRGTNTQHSANGQLSATPSHDAAVARAASTELATVHERLGCSWATGAAAAAPLTAVSKTAVGTSSPCCICSTYCFPCPTMPKFCAVATARRLASKGDHSTCSDTRNQQRMQTAAAAGQMESEISQPQCAPDHGSSNTVADLVPHPAAPQPVSRSVSQTQLGGRLSDCACAS